MHSFFMESKNKGSKLGNFNEKLIQRFRKLNLQILNFKFLFSIEKEI